MSRSNEAGHFFQTSDSLATTRRKEAKAKNKHGDPIQLPSKILAAIASPRDANCIYVAEAAGEVKEVNLETKKIKRIFTQGSAPLTCLAVQGDHTLFAGSWDKNIYTVDLSAQHNVRKLAGHADFVKCLLCTTLPGQTQQPILISGGADATIIIWSLSPSNFGTVLHKLKGGHTKALQCLIIDSFHGGEEAEEEEEEGGVMEIFSSSSDREIRKWRITSTEAYERPDALITGAHETSVYSLRLDGSGDLWTASADKSARHLVRDRGWEADTILEHPDFVRDVLAFEELGLVVTACRDEEVRVWESGSGALVCRYGGHFEEVTGLVAEAGRRGVVSVSIDGTVRRWSLERAEMDRYEEERGRQGLDQVENGVGEATESGGLTAEEEAELAELMDDDD